MKVIVIIAACVGMGIASALPPPSTSSQRSFSKPLHHLPHLFACQLSQFELFSLIHWSHCSRGGCPASFQHTFDVILQNDHTSRVVPLTLNADVRYEASHQRLFHATPHVLTTGRSFHKFADNGRGHDLNHDSGYVAVDPSQPHLQSTTSPTRRFQFKFQCHPQGSRLVHGQQYPTRGRKLKSGEAVKEKRKFTSDVINDPQASHWAGVETKDFLGECTASERQRPIFALTLSDYQSFVSRFPKDNLVDWYEEVFSIRAVACGRLTNLPLSSLLAKRKRPRRFRSDVADAVRGIPPLVSVGLFHGIEGKEAMGNKRFPERFPDSFPVRFPDRFSERFPDRIAERFSE